MQDLGNYKNFINLLEQKNINLDEYPLKSIYRKLKKIMDTDFDTVFIEDTPKILKIFGEYDKNRNGYCGKLYEINKETWKITRGFLGRVQIPASIDSISVNFIINNKWE